MYEFMPPDRPEYQWKDQEQNEGKGKAVQACPQGSYLFSRANASATMRIIHVPIMSMIVD